MAANKRGTTRAGGGGFDRFLDEPAVALEAMHEHLPGYLATLQDEGLSRSTQSNYRLKVGHFLDWLTERNCVFNRRATREYLTWMQLEGNYQPRTIRLTLAAIKSFSRYLSSLEVEVPPLDGLKTPRLPDSSRVSPTSQQVAQMFAAAQRLPAHQEPARFHKRLTLAVLGVFAFAGLRAAEFRDLDLDDYDQERGELIVRKAKGGQFRKLHVNSQLGKYLRDWLEVRAEVLAAVGRPQEKALFLNHRYRRIGRVALTNLWEEVLELAGLSGSRILRHSFRHWFATETARAEDIRTAQELLGHSSVQTTMAYLHTSPERKRSAVDKLAASLVLNRVDQPARKGANAPRRRSPSRAK
jgi:site-specific recombinase XerD